MWGTQGHPKKYGNVLKGAFSPGLRPLEGKAAAVWTIEENDGRHHVFTHCCVNGAVNEFASPQGMAGLHLRRSQPKHGFPLKMSGMTPTGMNVGKVKLSC
jgi:hypothetical protein